MNKLKIKFEKNVPIPPANRKASIYPFSDLELGGSMHVEVTGKDLTRVQTAAHKFGQYHGLKFTTRRSDTGIRIWRIE